MDKIISKLPSIGTDPSAQHQPLSSQPSSPVSASPLNGAPEPPKKTKQTSQSFDEDQRSSAATPTPASAWKGKGKEKELPQGGLELGPRAGPGEELEEEEEDAETEGLSGSGGIPPSPLGTRNKSIDGMERESMELTLALREEEEEEEGRAREGAAYPPMTDDDLEARKVEENLKRYEMIERQRRKAARESRSARAPTSIMGDVSRRASLLLFNRSNSVKQKPTTTTRPGSMSGNVWTAAKGRDSDDTLGSGTKLEMEEESGSPATTAASNRSSTPNINVNGAPMRRRSSSTSSSISTTTAKSIATTRSGPTNPFSSQFQGDSLPAANKNPFEPPSPTLLAPSAPKAREARRRSTTPSPTRPEAGEDDTEMTPTKKTSRKDKGKGKERAHTVDEGDLGVPAEARRRRTSALPAAMPLDNLPQPRMPAKLTTEANPDQGHWRRVMEQRELEEAILEEEERDTRSGGRWWTDWFCGCRESGSDKYHRNEQAGRTNPFE